MIDEKILKQIRIKDISDIDLDKVFLHYTNIANLNSIVERGLEPRIGINAKMVEASKKVFFSMGSKGALVIMDVWIKWLIVKPKSNYIYWLGAFLLRIPYFPKILHEMISGFSKRSRNKKKWAFKKMKTILDNSIYLILDLKENEDFSFTDIDEAKKIFKYSPKYVRELYAHDSDISNYKIEYWNMHTFSNKIITNDKISLLKINNDTSANEIIKFFASENSEYIKDNCKLLEEYLRFLDDN